jgi:hypothetical protein
MDVDEFIQDPIFTQFGPTRRLHRYGRRKVEVAEGGMELPGGDRVILPERCFENRADRDNGVQLVQA